MIIMSMMMMMMMMMMITINVDDCNDCDKFKIKNTIKSN